MDDQENGSSPLDYSVCGYRGTRMTFRGPRCDLDKPYIAALGGTETFGRFVETPYPALLSEWLGTPVANLGVCQAGLSLFSEEQWLLDAASGAQLTVFQILGAQNMSNRLYSVHTRRNDRFLAVSPALREIFPDVDFSEINFTGHLLDTLAARSRTSFEVVVEELKWAWVQRMRRLLRTIESDVVLLWLSDRRPEDDTRLSDSREPAFVDREMLASLAPFAAGLVEVVADDPSAPSRLAGKIFAVGEEHAAQALPGAKQHALAAERLATEIALLRSSTSFSLKQAGA